MAIMLTITLFLTIANSYALYLLMDASDRASNKPRP